MMKTLPLCFLVSILIIGAFVSPVGADDPSDAVFGESRPVDDFKPEELVGVTGMVRYTYRDWSDESQDTLGDIEFDSFRILARTTLKDRYYGSVQYRFYDGWQALHHLWIGVNTTKDSILRLGLTAVPFGIGWQTFDDWGNTPYYIGLQDDRDLGIRWELGVKRWAFDFGFFKNQQGSSDSPERYDADVTDMRIDFRVFYHLRIASQGSED